jgi:phage gp29-like protein
MLNMLERMVQDAIAVIPDDSSVDFLESGTRSASADIYEKLLTFSNMEISKAILGQTLTTEMQSVGSYAAAQVHLEVREEIVDADKRLVENTLNTLIRWIYEINFSDSGFPMFSMYEEEDVDKTLAERDKILVDSGVKFTRQYWLRTYKFDEEDIEEG